MRQGSSGALVVGRHPPERGCHLAAMHAHHWRHTNALPHLVSMDRHHGDFNSIGSHQAFIHLAANHEHQGALRLGCISGSSIPRSGAPPDNQAAALVMRTAQDGTRGLASPAKARTTGNTGRARGQEGVPIRQQRQARRAQLRGQRHAHAQVRSAATRRQGGAMPGSVRRCATHRCGRPVCGGVGGRGVWAAAVRGRWQAPAGAAGRFGWHVLLGMAVARRPPAPWVSACWWR
jgi:hypothetical protein